MRLLASISFLLCSTADLTANSDPPFSLEENLSLNGFSVRQALAETARDKILRSLVLLTRNERMIAHAILVDSRGYLLTKASSSVGARYANTHSGEKLPVRIRKRNDEADLALLQLIDQKNRTWPVVAWERNATLNLAGSFAVSASFSLDELRLGTITGSPRPIGREGGVMGVEFANEESEQAGASVAEIVPHAAADHAGLLPGDRILRVDGALVTSGQQIKEILQDKDPGDLVVLGVRRRDDSFTIRVTLGHRSVTFDLFNRNLLMSGPVSKRKDNFPLILQHDLPLSPQMMGGGLFDPLGNCLAVNVARIDRVTNYAIPHCALEPILNAWLAQLP